MNHGHHIFCTCHQCGREFMRSFDGKTVRAFGEGHSSCTGDYLEHLAICTACVFLEQNDALIGRSVDGREFMSGFANRTCMVDWTGNIY